MSDPSAKGTYALVTLGCPKNLVDSERMLGLLRARRLSDGRPSPTGPTSWWSTPAGSSTTPGEESLEVIDEMLRLKRRGPDAAG